MRMGVIRPAEENLGRLNPKDSKEPVSGSPASAEE